jgi:hypothetical protein
MPQAAFAAFSDIQWQGQLAEYGLKLPDSMTSFSDFPTPAKSTVQVALLDMSPQSFPGLGWIYAPQPLTDQIIIAAKNLFQDFQHQRVSELFQLIDNFIKAHFAGCQIESNYYMYFLFHHGLFSFGYLLAQKTLERDRDLFNSFFGSSLSPTVEEVRFFGLRRAIRGAHSRPKNLTSSNLPIFRLW